MIYFEGHIFKKPLPSLQSPHKDTAPESKFGSQVVSYTRFFDSQEDLCAFLRREWEEFPFEGYGLSLDSAFETEEGDFVFKVAGRDSRTGGIRRERNGLGNFLNSVVVPDLIFSSSPKEIAKILPEPYNLFERRAFIPDWKGVFGNEGYGYRAFPDATNSETLFHKPLGKRILEMEAPRENDYVIFA